MQRLTPISSMDGFPGQVPTPSPPRGRTGSGSGADPQLQAGHAVYAEAEAATNGARYTSVTQEVVDHAAQQVLGLDAGLNRNRRASVRSLGGFDATVSTM